MVRKLRFERAFFNDSSLKKIPVGEDPDEIEARSIDTFWDILRRAKVKFRRSEPLYNCNIHKFADRNRRQLAAAHDELTKLQSDLTAAETAEVSRLSDLVLPLKQKIADKEKEVETARVCIKFTTRLLASLLSQSS